MPAKFSNHTTNGYSDSLQARQNAAVWLHADPARSCDSTLHAGRSQIRDAKSYANRGQMNDAMSCAVRSRNHDRNSTRPFASVNVGWFCQSVSKQISKYDSTKGDANQNMMRSLPKIAFESSGCCMHRPRSRNGWRGCACCASHRIRCTGRRRASRVRHRTRIDRSCRIPLIRMKFEKRQGDYHNSI